MSNLNLFYRDSPITGVRVSEDPKNPGFIALSLQFGADNPFVSVTSDRKFNLPNSMRDLPRGCAFLNIGDFPYIEALVRENELGEPYLIDNSAFVRNQNSKEYILYSFSREALSRLDRSGCDEVFACA